MTKVIPLYPLLEKTKKPVPALPVQLEQLGEELGNEFASLLKKFVCESPVTSRNWLSSIQVVQQMKIPISLLQQLRDSKKVSFCFIDGQTYFDPTDLNQAIRRRKIKKLLK